MQLIRSANQRYAVVRTHPSCSRRQPSRSSKCRREGAGIGCDRCMPSAYPRFPRCSLFSKCSVSARQAGDGEAGA